MTMDDMPPTPAHARPARRDLLWVLVAILACGLLEVWASWLQVGAVSGFPKLGRMTTGWILPVTTEAYWSAALYAWLADPAGPRSRRFAMWSAAGMFFLSLAGQESGHLLAAAGGKVPPAGVVAFVTALPLLSIALIAVLIHLRHADREDAAETVRQDAEAVELAALRAELSTEREALQPLRDALATAREQAEEANARAESATAKLAAQKANRGRTKPANRTRRKANAAANGTAEVPANADPEQGVPEDFDARTQALEIYLGNPRISGKDLGEAVGLTARWGQLRKNEFAASAPAPASDPQEQP